MLIFLRVRLFPRVCLSLRLIDRTFEGYSWRVFIQSINLYYAPTAKELRDISGP